MNKFVLFHTYNNLVEEGKAEQILCPDDDQILISMIDSDGDTDDPILWCPTCDVRRRPGIGFWDQISTVVNREMQA